MSERACRGTEGRRIAAVLSVLLSVAGASGCGASSRGAASTDEAASLPSPIRDVAKYGAAFRKLHAACDGGGGAACVELGKMYLEGWATIRDETLAAEMFERECAKGSAEGCHMLAYCLEKGLGVAPDQTRARALQQAACRAESSKACQSVALRLIKEGGEKARREAAGLVRPFCEKRDLTACNLLAYVYSSDASSLDKKEAARIFAFACDAGERDSCRHLGAMYRDGEAVPRDKKRAFELFERSCSMGESTACTLLGGLLERGDGVEVDLPRALTLYETTCASGYSSACVDAGLFYQSKTAFHDASKAGDFFEKACNLKDALGCSLRADQLLEGDGVQKNPALGLDLYRRGCLHEDRPRDCVRFGLQIFQDEKRPLAERQGMVAYFHAACQKNVSSGCRWAGLLFQFDNKDAPAIQAFRKFFRLAKQGELPPDPHIPEKNCSEKAPGSCHTAALYRLTGLFVSRDEKAAVRLYEEGCRWGFPRSCARLGELLLDGRGVAVDRKRGLEYLQKACDKKEEGACARLTLEPPSAAGKKTAEMLIRDCDRGYNRYCLGAARVVDRGLQGNKRDEPRAYSLFSRACLSANSGEACASLAEMVSRRKAEASATNRLVTGLWMKACEHGHGAACFTAGQRIEQGIGIAADRARAREIYQDGCDAGDAACCKLISNPLKSTKH